MTHPDPMRGGGLTPSNAGQSPADADAALPIVVDANPMGVRSALAEMRARFAPTAPGPDMLGMAETVLAEVLNNVVEHAYRRGGNGPIELRLERCGGRLKVDVRDYGDPMPDGVLPSGALPTCEDAEDGPPEGGFGWFLIRALARDLSYTRENGQNRLRFFVPLADA
ncbi:ATP-binding protein [Rhodovulum steppense]|uniref:Serine/threonine-protein kinase RsbW n=1 Tax=Rhodovulum steppense TaxID=540251 RepID=A0A4R1Z1M5_9RHOB|nr:ATP-binding protein [Rhodovulum steppense]TCM87499.1 serine/threonine-protein kinase RsbW [Rhodovulum steppense]